MIELAGLTGLLMLVGCFVPRNRLPAKLPHDSVLHISAFALLTLPFCSLTTGHWELLSACAALWTLGLLIECAQHFVPNRSFGLDDLLYNAVGIAIVAIPCVLLAG